MKIDDVDLEIVRILSGDGRTSYSDIAKAVGVSVGTVRNRINQMRSGGLLRFNVWLDPNRSGLGINALILLKVTAGKLDDVIAELIGLNETGYVAALAGTYDATADIFCRDVPHLDQVVHEQMEQIDGVTEVFVHLVTDIKYESSLNIGGIVNEPEPR